MVRVLAAGYARVCCAFRFGCAFRFAVAHWFGVAVRWFILPALVYFYHLLPSLRCQFYTY